jgi:hypothetical protein
MGTRRIPGKLALNRETVRELTESDLEAAAGAGGGPQPTPPIYASIGGHACNISNLICNLTYQPRCF